MVDADRVRALRSAGSGPLPQGFRPSLTARLLDAMALGMDSPLRLSWKSRAEDGKQV